MTKLAVIGHSHTVALLDAIAAWRASVPMTGGPLPDGYPEALAELFSPRLHAAPFELAARPEFAAFDGAKVILFSPAVEPWVLATAGAADGAIEGSAALTDCIQALADRDTVVSQLYGSEPCEIGLINRFPDYDFAPYEMPGAHQPIDVKYIRAILHQMVVMVVLPLTLIRRAMPGVRILHLGPPPPLQDPSATRHVESFAAAISKFGVTRAALRLKWHNAYLEAMRRMLWPLGVQMIDPPSGALSADGFLRPELAESLNHANAGYGALMAARVAAIVLE